MPTYIPLSCPLPGCRIINSPSGMPQQTSRPAEKQTSQAKRSKKKLKNFLKETKTIVEQQLRPIYLMGIKLSN